MNKLHLLTILIIFHVIFLKTTNASTDDEIWLTFIHLNDVYEITSVSGGTQGGIARITTLKKQLLAQNPNTYITLSGDVYGPSGLSNVAIVDGELLAGKHVVAVLNKVGIDYFTFGDHEFDQFSAAQILRRFQETTFPIISSNYADANGKAFQQSNSFGDIIDIPKNVIFTATNARGNSIRVGIIGVSEPFRKSDLTVTYTDHETAISEQITELKGSNNPVDVLVAMTHFGIAIDKAIAAANPQIDLILGGDDHNIQKEEADGFPPIYKSDSNARNIYIIDFYYDTATGKVRIEDRIQPVTNAITDDPEVLAEVDKWVKIGYDALRVQGFSPEHLIGIPPFDLDGFATSIRSMPTELTSLITQGAIDLTNADLSMLVSGLLRLDDLIPAGGQFVEYDVIRSYPSDDNVASVKMLGSNIILLLDANLGSQGSGAYLFLSDNITRDETNSVWLLNGISINATQEYTIAFEQTTAESIATGMLVAFDTGEFVKLTETTIRQILTNQVAKISTDNGPGDSNGDDVINALDIISVLSIIFNKTTTTGSDCNIDMTVNILDIICIINKIFAED